MRLAVLPTVLLALLTATGCDGFKCTLPPAASPARLSGPAEIALGAAAVVDGVATTFEAIEEDSRCPKGVECIWAGEAVVGLTLDGEHHAVRVAAPDLDPEAGVLVGGRVVFATALTPEPEVDDQGAPLESDEAPVVTIETVPAD